MLMLLMLSATLVGNHLSAVERPTVPCRAWPLFPPKQRAGRNRDYVPTWRRRDT